MEPLRLLPRPRPPVTGQRRPSPRLSHRPPRRLSAKKRETPPFRLYAEGLFGKNEVTYSPDTSTGSLVAAKKEYIGTTRSIVTGLDLHTGTAFDWRALEFSKGTFTGLHGSYPQTLQTGILFHFP